ncbi:hypothetical protein [Dactylosporangium sp. CA-092794]|uniref:hypothetical protein n=1 Tax=Dactylosporangium sp. CA-092794 TaxID=3239929 RepID=UPI003D8C05A8
MSAEPTGPALDPVRAAILRAAEADAAERHRAVGAEPTGPALDPVRAAILRAAEADAAERHRAAGERAGAALAQARAAAEEILRSARRAGAADAAAVATGELARRGRKARTLLLSARQERYDEVRRLALRRLRAAGLDGVLRERITGALGPGATITAAPDGGLIGTAADRTVDCSLSALVDHAMAAAAGRIEEAWT